MPQADGVGFKPLVLCVSQGYCVNLLRVRNSGVLSRHRHNGPVRAITLRGRWHYLEHDWEAGPMSYEDVFTRLDACKAHYAKTSLGADHVNGLVR